MMRTCRDFRGLVRELPALAVNQGRLAHRLALARGEARPGGREPETSRRSASQRPAHPPESRLQAVVETLLGEPQAARDITSLVLPVEGRGGRRGRVERRALRRALDQLPGLCPRLRQLTFTAGPGQAGATADFDVVGLEAAAWLDLGRLRRLPAAGLGGRSGADKMLRQLSAPLAQLTGLSQVDGPAPLGERELAAMRSLKSLAVAQLPSFLGAGRALPRLPVQQLHVGEVASPSADPRAWLAFGQLTHLRIDACAAPGPPPTLWQLGRLVELKLSRVELAWELPEGIHALTALTRLHLCEWPELQRVQLDLERLPALVRLDVHRLPRLADLHLFGHRLAPMLQVDALDLATDPAWEALWPPEGDRGEAPAIRFRSRMSPTFAAELTAELEGGEATGGSTDGSEVDVASRE